MCINLRDKELFHHGARLNASAIEVPVLSHAAQPVYRHLQFAEMRKGLEVRIDGLLKVRARVVYGMAVRDDGNID